MRTGKTRRRIRAGIYTKTVTKAVGKKFERLISPSPNKLHAYVKRYNAI